MAPLTAPTVQVAKKPGVEFFEIEYHNYTPGTLYRVAPMELRTPPEDKEDIEDAERALSEDETGDIAYEDFCEELGL